MVKLQLMTNEDYKKFINESIEDYAKEKVKAGNWVEKEAIDKSKKEFDQLLPEGKDTKDNYLFSLIDESVNKKVGYIWFKVNDHVILKEAFIYDFMIYEEFRRCGYGTEAMKALDEKVKSLGVNKVSLHVFEHNQKAIGLYKKTGYKITNLYMSKMIE